MMPVPVMRITPQPNSSAWQRRRYATSSSNERCIWSVELSPLKNRAPSRWISRLDRQRARVRDLPRQGDDRAEGGAGAVDLGLRQVDRVLALDAAGRDVVADGVAGDLARRVDQQRHLRLRHVPRRVAPDRDRLARRRDAIRRGLEEDFGPLGVVDLRVDVLLGGLFHPGVTAAQVRHTGRPDLLVVDWRRERDRSERDRCPRPRRPRRLPAGRPGSGRGRRPRVPGPPVASTSMTWSPSIRPSWRGPLASGAVQTERHGLSLWVTPLGPAWSPYDRRLASWSGTAAAILIAPRLTPGKVRRSLIVKSLTDFGGRPVERSSRLEGRPMQRWIGLLVMVLGIAHVAFAIVAGWSDLGDILRGGVAGLESAPSGHEAAFWSLLFGGVAATVGYQLYWSAKRFGVTSLVPGVGADRNWHVRHLPRSTLALLAGPDPRAPGGHRRLARPTAARPRRAVVASGMSAATAETQWRVPAVARAYCSLARSVPRPAAPLRGPPASRGPRTSRWRYSAEALRSARKSIPSVTPWSAAVTLASSMVLPVRASSTPLARNAWSVAAGDAHSDRRSRCRRRRWSPGRRRRRRRSPTPGWPLSDS